MKYTEAFFRFPIKVYDMKSIRDMEKMEDMKESLGMNGEQDEPVWRSCQCRLPASAFTEGRVYWHEAFNSGEEEKRDITIVYHKKFGSFTCLWNIKHFEEELDKFMDQFMQELNKSA